MTGTPLSILTAPLHLSGTVSQQSGLSAYQLEMFGGLQKSLDRTGTSLMKCMGDVLRYRKLSKCPALWASILELWEQAARVYSRKVRTLHVCSITFHTHTNPTPHDSTPLKFRLLSPSTPISLCSFYSLPPYLPPYLPPQHHISILSSLPHPIAYPHHTPTYSPIHHTHTHTHTHTPTIDIRIKT